MKHPGYLLNPGDMFQVDPERVMFATGAPKGTSDTSTSGDEEEEAEEETPSESEDDGAAASESQPEETKREGEDEKAEQNPREVLKSLLAQAKSVLWNPSGDRLTARRKQHLRGFQKQVKRQLSRSHSSTIMSDSLEAQFRELKNQLLRQPSQLPSEQAPSEYANARQSTDQPQSTDRPSEQNPTPATSKPPSPNNKEEDEKEAEDAEFSPTDSDLETLRRALSRLHFNPIDPSKPYATPWTPRPYMSAFAFIPRYLEVNQNICAAVYLRHPVARPGMAEVPSPFSEVTASNAFAWYLRRR
jgi:ribosomal protein S4